MPEQPTALYNFSGQYGRLCTLVAQALTRGYGRPGIVDASCGRGSETATVYVELRKQRGRVNKELTTCKAAGVPDEEIVSTARGIRAAIEQEWDRKVPMMA